MEVVVEVLGLGPRSSMTISFVFGEGSPFKDKNAWKKQSSDARRGGVGGVGATCLLAPLGCADSVDMGLFRV